MNWDEYTEMPCIVPRLAGAQNCPTRDTRCDDLEWAADNPDQCHGSPTITGLKVVPPSASVEVGDQMPYAAYLVFSDGRRKDVSAGSAWASSDDSVASIAEDGLATGQAIGVVTVHATYRGLFDFAQLAVSDACDQPAMDIVLVFDRSAGMGNPFTQFGGGASILDLCKDAARTLVRGVRLRTVDRIAVVSCAGTYDETKVPAYHPDANLHIILSGSEPDILAAVNSVQMGNCYLTNSEGKHVSECATGLGAGLQKAYDELTSARARAGSRKVVILCSLGYEVYCAPDPIPIAANMRALGWSVIGIVPVPSFDHFPCNAQSPMGTWAYVQQMVTCDLFYGVTNPDQLPAAFAACLPDLCGKQGDPCLYYIPWAGAPPPAACYRDQLDFLGWKNWDVVGGFVDLLGIDLYPLFPPGHGLYMDLVGTDQENNDPHPEGTIESKRMFNFGPGRYRFSFEMAGNNRQDRGAMSVAVSIGTILSATIQISNWIQPFTLYKYDFSITDATAGKIRFKHNTIPPIYTPTIGLLLDNVKLENLDTGEVLLYDTFDEENPC